MKLTKNVISREQALKISQDYVKFVEGGDFDLSCKVVDVFEKMKRGQKALSYHEGQFVLGKISSMDHKSFQAVDGPVVRFSNGEYSWRVDGSRYACPVE